MNPWLLLMLSAVPDYCAWEEPRQQSAFVEPDERAMMKDGFEIRRSYKAAWARCALDRGGTPPLLKVTVKDGTETKVLLEKKVELHASLDPFSTSTLYETFRVCEPPANQREKGAVLFGPHGRRRWMNPRKVTVELIAQGPMAPIGFKRQFEVLCPACAVAKGVASMHHYVADHHANQTRFYVSVPKERYACAQGGGRMIVRRYWVDKGGEEWRAVHPYEAIDDFQNKLRLQDDAMFFESREPGANFCKEGKINLWEVIGLDEYATIVNTSSYGPSSHIRRGTIEFLKCK